MTQAVMDQLNKNQAAYEAMQTEMERKHMGRILLMHDGEMVEVYNNRSDAYKIGCEKFGMGKFSLVTVGERPIELGFFGMFISPKV